MPVATVWIGSLAEPAPGEVRIDLGEDHPTRAGLLGLRVDLDDDIIAHATIEAGHLHRGAEKLFEVRDYRVGLALADRHDWQSPVGGELSYALAAEQALGIPVPPRANRLRTLAAEHSRLHGLLGLLAWRELDLDVGPLRELLRRQLQAWTGNRLHPMLTRLGGVAADVDDEWLAAERDLARRAREFGVRAEQAVAAGADALAGLAVIDAASAAGLGLSGPALRAAGVARDLRVDDPYCDYGAFAIAVPTRATGDALARLELVAADVVATAGLIDQLAREVPPGAVDTRLPKIIRLPEGSYYRPVESPLGEAGLRIVSRGDKTPWRVMLRTPSLPLVMALEQVLAGVRLEEVEAVVASLGYVIGDVDK